MVTLTGVPDERKSADVDFTTQCHMAMESVSHFDK